jgi:hypothetical protein
MPAKLKPSAMGGSFAERKAANEGATDFDVPEPPKTGNSTFAERGKATASKAVDSGDAEDKSVSSGSAEKRTARKS